jgi:hypothetical protein
MNWRLFETKANNGLHRQLTSAFLPPSYSFKTDLRLKDVGAFEAQIIF